MNWTSGNGKRIAMLLCLLAVLALLGLSTRGSLQGPEGLPVRGAVEQGEKPGTSGAASSLSVPESGSLPESPAPAGEEPSPEEAVPPVEPEPPSSQPDVPAPVSSESQPEVAVPIFTPYGPEEPVEDYVDWLVQRTLAEIQHPGMTEYEKAKAAYDYLLDSVTSDDLVCPEIWRVYSEDPDTPIPYLENRALSILRFHVGMCEDQAAALVLLLRGMGMEAEYLPGFMFTLAGEPMDHAWVQVKVDGVWYHMDPELEGYRARRDKVRYLYFLKGDQEMERHHQWGEATLGTPWLTGEQKEEVRQSWLGRTCPRNYPAQPETRTRDRWDEVDVELARREADAEIAAWEAEHGKLAPIQLNITPPVFGFEGYGPTFA